MHDLPQQIGMVEHALLRPPYESLTTVLDVPARSPLGTILHVWGSSALAILGSVTSSLESCPWLVPVVVLPQNEVCLQPLIALFGGLRGRVAVADTASFKRPTIEWLIDAAKQREQPDGQALATYTMKRIADPALSAPLTEQFTWALNGDAHPLRSVATYSRIFAHHQPFTARHWRALAQLAFAVILRQRERAPVMQRMRESYVVLPQRITHRASDRYAQHFLGMSFEASISRVGWEWVIEHALRRARYVSIARPESGASAPHTRREPLTNATIETLR
jgi:hypothetical protein